MFSEARVTAVANQIMRAVVASGVVSHANLDVSSRVMREEMKALMFDEFYEGTRRAVINRSISEQTAISLVVTECISKIKEAA